MDSSFSRQTGSGMHHTPRSSFTTQQAPMTMGSPSPNHLGNQSYLPGYLLGGNTPSQMSFSDVSYGQGSKSPGKMKSTWSPSRSGSSGYHHRFTSLREKKDLESRQSFSGTTNNHTPKGARGKVPPVSDLFTDTIIPNAGSPFNKSNQMNNDINMTVQTQTNSPSSGGQYEQNSLKNHLFSPSRKQVASPAQVDPFYSQGEQIASNESLDECCVTIFGFPPAASSFILQKFSQYGNILKHEVSSNGNWVHIRYQSKLQAKKALSKNGKVFGSNMMIGCKQCIDKNFMFETGKENRVSTSSSINDIPVDSPKSTTPNTSRTPIRPLTAAYRAANSDLEVSGSQTPQKNNNLVSKAMEYVFGW